MKPRLIILTGALLLAFTCLTGQKPLKVYLRYIYINEVSAGIKLETKENNYLFAEAGYIIPLRKEAYYNLAFMDFWTFLLRGINTKGFNFRLGWNLSCKSKKCQDLLFEYGNLNSNNFIIHRARFGGLDEAEYSEFTEKYNNFAVIYSKTWDVSKNQNTFIVFSAGAKYKNIWRDYSICGEVGGPYPCDRTERLHQFYPVLNIGARYYFIK